MTLKLIVVFLLISCNCLFSQEKREIDNTITTETSAIFSYQNSNFLQLQQIEQANSEINSLTENEVNNIAIIEQIGDNNFVQADNFAGSSRLLYAQNGNRNSIVNQNNLNMAVTQLIVQSGNDNAVNAISSGDLDIIQNGNGIIYEQIGTNALTNSLQLRLEGNARTVSVRTINVSN